MALPISLDQIADILSQIIIWWTQLVKGIPSEQLPIIAYGVFSVIVLLLWVLVVRAIPTRTLAGLSWIVLFAILLTPTTSLGTKPEFAPASISVFYGILLKDNTIVFNGLLPIMVVITAGCVIGFLWQILRMGLEKMDKKSSKQTETTA